MLWFGHGLSVTEGKDTSVSPVAKDANMGLEDHAMVWEASKHFVREWSEFSFQGTWEEFLIFHCQVTRYASLEFFATASTL